MSTLVEASSCPGSLAVRGTFMSRQACCSCSILPLDLCKHLLVTPNAASCTQPGLGHPHPFAPADTTPRQPRSLLHLQAYLALQMGLLHKPMSPDSVLLPDSRSHSQFLLGAVPSSCMSPSLRVCSAEVVSSGHQGCFLIYHCALIRTCGACPLRYLWVFTLSSSRDFHTALERFVRDHSGVLYKMT